MAHKFTDKRGTESWRNSVRAGGLYPNPQRLPNTFRPRQYFTPSDTSVGFSPHDRQNVLRYSRELFAGSPNLNGAVNEKARYSIQDGFTPRFRGDNFAWGEQVEEWLKTKFYPVCNVAGGNYNFLETLKAISIALDVDGDCLIYLTQSRDGFPQIGTVASHRIGQRESGERLVKSGRYKGNRIIDGIIVNANLRPIAYRILGDTPDEDYELSAQSALLLFEPQWTDSIRGVSNFGSCLIDALNKADIDFYLQQGVKLDSAIGILAYTESGQADPSVQQSNITAEDGVTIASPLVSNPNSALAIEPMLGGLINYFRANSGEKLESFRTDRPHSNVEQFVARLERRCMDGLQWPYEMLNPAAAGAGAPVRLVQSKARNSIRSRQTTLSRASKFIVAYAIAVGMGNELIPANYNDNWYNWQFNYGPLLTVDNGYEAEADRKGLLLGTTTLEEIAAKNGQDWYELRQQTSKEVNDLLDRAQTVATKYKISIDKALDLLSQRSANPTSTAAPAQVDSNN